MVEPSALSEWIARHGGLVPYLSFSCGSDRDREFRAQRAAQIAQQTKILTAFRAKSEKRRAIAERNLSGLVAGEIPDAPYLCYESKSDVMYIRMFTAVRQKLRRRQISLVTNLYGLCLDNIQNANDLLELLPLLPENQYVAVDSALLTFGNEKTERCKRETQYLTEAVRRMCERVEAMERAPWARDYNGFFVQLVEDAVPRFLSDTSYLFPQESEVSLSRCFFCYKSHFSVVIDEVVDQIQSIPLTEFASILVNFCLNSIPNRYQMGTVELSVALVILYRCVFHRCYEKYPSFFAPKFNGLPSKMEEIAELPAKLFHIPGRYMDSDDMEQPIRELFGNNQYFKSAAMFLYQTVFCSNPLDALYNVHKSLMMVHKAALLNEKKNGEVGVDDLKQIICFDDLFSLFFGTLMCSEHPDMGYTQWLIASFLDINSLSSPFEYAATNLEGIVSHCKNIRIDEYRQKLRC